MSYDSLIVIDIKKIITSKTKQKNKTKKPGSYVKTRNVGMFYRLCQKKYTILFVICKEISPLQLFKHYTTVEYIYAAVL